MASIAELAAIADSTMTKDDIQKQTATQTVHKYFFGKDNKNVLLRAVREHNAHRDPHGKKMIH